MYLTFTQWALVLTHSFGRITIDARKPNPEAIYETLTRPETRKFCGTHWAQVM